MELLLKIDEPLLLNFFSKMGTEKTQNLIMTFLKTYAETCTNNDNILESAIIESQKTVCNQMITKQDVSEVISSQLREIPGSRDIENLKLSIIGEIGRIFTTSDNNLSQKDLESMRINLLSELKLSINEEIGKTVAISGNNLSQKDLESMRDNLLRELKLTTLKTDNNQISQQVERLFDNISDILKKVDGMNMYFSKESSVKGEITENVYETLLNEEFKNAEITRTSNLARAGDFIISIHDKRYMVDIKNYTRNVPSNEINKLARDVRECKVDGGILVSTNSGICGVDRIGVIQPDNIPIVLLPDNGTNVHMVDFAIKFINCYTPKETEKDKINKSDVDDMINKIRASLTGFDDAVKQILDTKKKVMDMMMIEKTNDNFNQNAYCKQCDKIFKTASALKSHNRYKHKDE